MSDERTGQIPVSPNNPCPFLRALVANGYVGGHVVPLSQIAEMVGLASGETGSAQRDVRIKTRMVAVIANGLGRRVDATDPCATSVHLVPAQIGLARNMPSCGPCRLEAIFCE